MESKNDAIWKRAKFLAKNFSKDELQSVTLLIMYDLELPLNYSGFGYLKNAIPVAFRRPSQIIAKEIYLAVSGLYTPEVDVSSIESAIRDTIEKAWKDRGGGKWKFYFPYHMIQKEKPPSNVEFIAGIVYFLEMWQGCCKEGDYARE